MDDHQLAIALTEADRMERDSRAYWSSLPVDNLAERDAALIVMRHATALKRSLEQWISARAMRAVLVKSA